MNANFFQLDQKEICFMNVIKKRIIINFKLNILLKDFFFFFNFYLKLK